MYESSHSSQLGGGYKTNKNSSLVLNQWKSGKKKILQRHLDVIEETCRELLVKLGYKFGID